MNIPLPIVAVPGHCHHWWRHPGYAGQNSGDSASKAATAWFNPAFHSWVFRATCTGQSRSIYANTRSTRPTKATNAGTQMLCMLAAVPSLLILCNIYPLLPSHSVTLFRICNRGNGLLY